MIRSLVKIKSILKPLQKIKGGAIEQVSRNHNIMKDMRGDPWLYAHETTSQHKPANLLCMRSTNHNRNLRDKNSDMQSSFPHTATLKHPQQMS